MRLTANRLTAMFIFLMFIVFLLSSYANYDTHELAKTNEPNIILKSQYGDPDIQNIRAIYDPSTGTRFILVRLMDGSYHVTSSEFTGEYPNFKTIYKRR